MLRTFWLLSWHLGFLQCFEIFFLIAACLGPFRCLFYNFLIHFCILCDSEMFRGLVAWLPNITDRQYVKTFDETSLVNVKMHVLQTYTCTCTYTHRN